MEFKNMAWAIIIFSLIIIAATTIVDEWAVEYNPGIRSDLSGDFDRLENMSTTAEEFKGRTSPQSSEADDPETATYRGGFGIVSNMFAPFRTVYGMMDSAAERWGLPDYLIKALVAMFSFAILFGIIAIVFRLARPSA